MGSSVFIPTPIAPARPLEGGSSYTPATLATGQAVLIDQYGNMTNQSGISLGSLPGVPSVTSTQNALSIPNSSNTPSDSGDPFFTSSAATTSLSDALNSGLNAIDAVTGAANSSNPNGNQQIPFLGISFHDAVVVLIGIILVAAGVFAFKQTQTIINTGGKFVKKGAAVAASVTT